MNPYRLIARFYDHYLDESLYQDFLSLIQTEITSGYALDLATGTGQMAFVLAKNSFKVDAVDISIDMLKEAKKHLSTTNLPITFHVHDILEPMTSTNYDVVTLASDVVNHLSTIEDVSRVFHSIYESLKPGGIFVFDAIHEDFMNSLVGYEDVLLLDQKKLYWSVKKENNHAVRHLIRVDQDEATLIQYVYSIEELTKHLLLNKLNILKKVRTSERTMFLIKKEQ